MLKKALFILLIFCANCQLFSNDGLESNFNVEADFEFNNACLFEVVQFIDMSSGNIQSWSWNFDNGQGTSSEQFPEFTFSGAGTFAVELIVSDSISADTIVKIIEIFNQIPTFQDTVVCNNVEIEFNGNIYSEFVGSTTVFNYIDTLISSQGCDSISILRMTVNPCECKLTFPNAFTPNGDGVNDNYCPVVVCDQEIIDYWMIIYDRWGETVFESYDPKEYWDGTINGLSMPMDVFMVWVRYEIFDGEKNNFVKEVKDFTLIR